MNETFNTILSINTNYPYSKKYDKPTEEVMDSRRNLFDIVKRFEATEARQRMYRGYLVPPTFSKDKNSIYDLNTSLEKIEQMELSMTDGNVYAIDIETIGQPLNKIKNISPADRLNNDIFTATEIAINKQSYVGGQKVGKPESVVNFTSTPTAEELRVYVDNVFNFRLKADSTVISSLSRISGYKDPDGYSFNEKTKKWEVTSFDNNAKINVKEDLNKGINVFSQRAQYTKGTKEYNEAVKGIYDTVYDIIKQDSNALITINGEAFDIPVLMSVFERAGIDISDDFREKLGARHVDMQQVIKGVSREKVRERIKAAREAGMDINDNLKLETLSKAYKHMGADIDLSKDSHVGSVDGSNTLLMSDYAMVDVIQSRNKIIEEIKEGKTKNAKQTIYHANSSVIASPEDIFFSDAGFYNANNYNPTIMEAGHFYQISVLNIKEDKLPEGVNLPDNMKDKKILKMLDISTERESYLLVNSDKDLQEKILNTENVSFINRNNNTDSLIKDSTEKAIKDKSRVFKENMFKNNSSVGFSTLESYLDAIKHYVSNEATPSRDDFEKRIFSVKTAGHKDEALDKALEVVFNKEDSLVHERVLNMVNSYEDLQANSNFYSDIVDIVNSTVGSYEDFLAHNQNLSQGGRSRRLYEQLRTSTARSVKTFLEEKALSLIDDDEALDYIIKNNEEASNDFIKGTIKLWGERIQYLEKKHGKEIKDHYSVTLRKKDVSKLRRSVYAKHFGKSFDRESEEFKKMVFGQMPIKNTQRVKDGFDILSKDGSYSRIQANSKNNIIKGLQKEIYQKSTSKNKSKAIVKRDRDKHLSGIIEDLGKRGIFDVEQINEVANINTIDGAISYIADNVFKIKKISDNPRGIKDEVLKEKVKNYTANHNMKDIYDSNEYYSVLNMSAEEFFYKNYTLREVNKDGSFGLIKKEILDVAEKAGATSLLVKDKFDFDSKEATVKLLTERYNWKEQNAKNFINNYLSSKKFLNFEYNNGVNPGGFSHEIREIGDEAYVISTPLNKGRMVSDLMAGGAGIDEVKQHSIVLKLPKIKNHNNNRVILQGEETYKAIINSVQLSANEEITKDGAKKITTVLKSNDTVDDFIGRASTFNLDSALKSYSVGDVERANKILQRSWKPIKESKSLSAIETRVSVDADNNPIIFKSVGMNRADRVLGSSHYIGDMIYSLDMVFEENQALSESFKKVDQYGNIRKGIRETVESNKPSYKRKAYSKFNTDVKLWFMENIKEIAQTIIDTPSIELDDASNSVVHLIAKRGREVFYGKDTGDVEEGLVSTTTYLDMVPDSKMSNTTRPLLNQNLVASTMYKDDIKTSFNMNATSGAVRFNSADEIFEALGIKLGFGNHTVESLNFTKDLRTVNAGAADVGLRVKTKFMRPKEFLDNIYNIQDMNLEDLFKAKDGIFLKELEKFGGVASDITMEEVALVARNIASNTNLHEDSSLLSPFLQDIMGPNSITSLKIGEGFEKKLKIGQIINTGDELSFDGSIKSNKNTGRITAIKKGKIYISTNENLRVTKVSYGPYEKSMGVSAPHTPSIKYSKQIQHALISYMGDGANAIANPSFFSHQSFGSLSTAYFNAVTSNLKDNEAEKIESVKKLLNKHMPHKSLVRDSSGFIILNSRNNEGGSYSSYNDFFQEAKNISPEIKKSIEDAELNNLFLIDMGRMADNTVFGYQSSENIGKGANISYRSQQVMGAFMGGDSLEELISFRNIVDGRMQSLWQPIIDSDMKEIMNDRRFILAQEQVQNIKVALGDMINVKIKGAIIKDFALEDSAVAMSILSAQDIPEVFKHDSRNRVHGYRIDLSDINYNIENPISYLLEKGNFDKSLLMEHDKYIKSIVIPSLEPNYLDEGYTLSNLQKKGADLLNKVNQAKNMEVDNVKNHSVELNRAVLEYFDALLYELNDKDGLNKSSMKTKGLFSQIAKGIKVAALETTGDVNNLKYKDFDFGRTSTINGKHYSSLIMSVEDFKNMGLEFDEVGKQVFLDGFDQSNEALDVVKKVMSEKGLDADKALQVSKAKSIQEIISITGDASLATDKDFLKKIGTRYMSDIGIYGQMMRDPAVRTNESYKATKIRIGDVSQGSFSIDAVSASDMKADIDGDSINIWFRGLTTNSAGKVVLKSLESVELLALRDIMENSAVLNMRKFISLTEKARNEEKLDLSIKSYMAEMEAIGKDLVNVDFANDIDRHAALYAKVSKGTIGQISSPNYSLRSAMTNHYSRKPYDSESYRAIKNINFFTDLTEQSLIDTKSIGASGNAFEKATQMANLAADYRKNMGKIAQRDERARKASIKRMYTDLLDLEGISVGNIKLEIGTHIPKDQELREKAIDDAVDRIMTGKVNQSLREDVVTLEEALSQINKVFEDEQSVDLYHSSFVQQTSKSFSQFAGKDMTDEHYEMDNPVDYAYKSINPDVENQAEFSKILNSLVYFDSSITLDEKMVNVGDVIQSLKEKSGVKEGYYTVDSIIRDTSTISLNLKEAITGDILSLKGDSANELSKRIHHMFRMSLDDKKSSDPVKKYVDSLSTTYLTQARSGYEGFNKVNSLINDYNINRGKSVRHRAAKELDNLFDFEILSDVMSTAEILKNKGYISDTDASSFIYSMNKNIIKKGDSTERVINYSEDKIASLLTLNSLKNKSKITTTSGMIEFLNKTVTSESISNLKESINYTNMIKDAESKISGQGRVDLNAQKEFIISDVKKRVESGEILSSDKEQVIMDAIKNIHDKDNESKRLYFSLAEDYSYNSDLMKNFFGIDKEKIQGMVDSDDIKGAFEAINEIIVPYGEHIGYKFKHLNDEQINSILSSNVGKNVNSNVVSELSSIINLNNELKGGYVTRPVIENKGDEKIVSDTIERINKRIQEESASNSKANKKGGKFILDKLNDVVNKAKSNKNLIFGALAVGAAAVGGSALYGASKLDEKEREFVKHREGNIEEEKVKMVNNNAPASPKFLNQETPYSQHYRDVTSPSVSITGKSPTNTSSSRLSDIMNNVFAGTNIEVRSSIRDDRSEISNREVDRVMSQAIR